MNNMGYTEDQISLILSSYPIRKQSESTLLYAIKNLTNFFHRNGVDNTDIVYITTIIPNIIMMSIENIKERIQELLQFGFLKSEVFQMLKTYPYLFEMSNQRIQNKYQLFQEMGFQASDCNEIFVKRPNLLNRDLSSIKKRIQYLFDFGYDANDLLLVIRSVPELIDINQSTLTHKIEELKYFGFTQDEIIKITSYLPELYIYSKDEIEQKTKYLTENYFTTRDIINTIKKVPLLLKHDHLENIEENIENLETLGFGKSEIVPLTEKNPYVLVYSKEMVSENFKIFIHYGFYNQEVVKMMKDTPLLLTYNSKELNKRLHYYKDQKLLDEIKNHSKYMLYSLELIQKRASLIKNKKKSDVFLNDIEFEEKYHKTREDVLRGDK